MHRRRVLLLKAKKRPIGHRTAGGYVKTVQGWRKVATGRARTLRQEKLPPLPSYGHYIYMSVEQLHGEAYKHNVLLPNLSNDNAHILRFVVYQLELAKALGFGNKERLSVVVDRVADPQSPTTRAMYVPSQSVIKLGEQYSQSFIHEYFHHLWYGADPRLRVKFATKLDTVAPRAMWQYRRLDAQAVTLGYRAPGHEAYYAQPTEVASRFGHQAMDLLLRRIEAETGTRLPEIVDADDRSLYLGQAEYTKVYHLWKKLMEGGS